MVIEGPDGAGKTTHIRLLARALTRLGLRTLVVREPGGTTAGEAIRRILLSGDQQRLTPLAEAFLFQAARAQLVRQVIRPALARGTWVLTDRYWLSTLIYQGYAGGVSPSFIRQLSRLATGGLEPDLYVVLWVPRRLGLARRRRRQTDRMEAKGRRFLEAVGRAYRRLALASRGRIKLLDSRGPVAQVHARIRSCVERLLP